MRNCFPTGWDCPSWSPALTYNGEKRHTKSVCMIHSRTKSLISYLSRILNLILRKPRFCKKIKAKKLVILKVRNIDICNIKKDLATKLVTWNLQDGDSTRTHVWRAFHPKCNSLPLYSDCNTFYHVPLGQVFTPEQHYIHNLPRSPGWAIKCQQLEVL
jgi:hypothetical protein